MVIIFKPDCYKHGVPVFSSQNLHLFLQCLKVFIRACFILNYQIKNCSTFQGVLIIHPGEECVSRETTSFDRYYVIH